MITSIISDTSEIKCLTDSFFFPNCQASFNVGQYTCLSELVLNGFRDC